MAKRKRRRFTPEDKVAFLKEHLVDKKPVSQVCDTHALKPNQFYSWQKRFFENGAEAFRSAKADPVERSLRHKLDRPEKKLVNKDAVIADISEEYVDFVREWSEKTALPKKCFVAWDIRESMTTGDAQIVIEKTHEAYPEATLRLISSRTESRSVSFAPSKAST